MAYFRNKTIQGQVYDLSHLEPFTFVLEVEGQEFHVSVEFSCHCFTETFGAERTLDLKYVHAGETRAFDVIRHALSKKLPDMIRKLGNQSVYHSEQGNFFVLRDQELDGGKQPYLIFFNTFKATSKAVHVRLVVRSAYLKPNMSRWGSPIRFSTLVKATTENRPLKMGPRVQVKRK